MKSLIFVLSVIILFTGLITVNSIAQGTNTEGLPLTQPTLGSIVPFTTETGFISLSIDAAGTNGASAIIQVQKPAGATVRKAYMAAASTGFSTRVLANGDVKINGIDVVWDLVASTPSSIASHNSLADVTSIIKPAVDAALTGRVDFTITEVNTLGIDGEILAVIFDDPNQTTSNTVALLFGAENVLGDNFAIGLAEPLNLSDPNLKLDLSLGISFGAQACSDGQYSQVDVNGTRMTTSAGGEDDGTCANGALITVGGLDDNNANPANPFQVGTSDPRYDDELYNLIPFVTDGATTINVYTLNPSIDDNIFFAGLFLTATTAVVGEGILLAPLDDTNNVGTTHTVTATVQNNLGQPIQGRLVTFLVTSGPHVGQTGTGTTNASGQATFTYTGTTIGTDVLIATMTNTAGQLVSSNEVRKVWISTTPTTCPLSQGYWKNHDNSWPVENLTLGTIDYSKQSLLKILNTPIGLDKKADASLILADQLIAAKLNIANGADPSPISSTIAASDALIGNRVIPIKPKITPNTAQGKMMVELATKLDKYNNGYLIVGCIPPVPNIGIGYDQKMPTGYTLESNYPNPFNPTTSINYSLPTTSTVKLAIYDLLGREIVVLVDGVEDAGYKSVEWNAVNTFGSQLASGTYFYRLEATDINDFFNYFKEVRKMFLVK